MFMEKELIKDKDIIVNYIPVENKPNEPKRGVKIKHIPTSIEVQYNKSISRNTNYLKCLQLLIDLLVNS